MKKTIESITDLNAVVYERWTELDKLDSKYLNEAGFAAKEAYRAIIWHLAFHDTLESLRSDLAFRDLVNIPNKHPEYYKVLRKVNRFLERR